MAEIDKDELRSILNNTHFNALVGRIQERMAREAMAQKTDDERALELRKESHALERVMAELRSTVQ